MMDPNESPYTCGCCYLSYYENTNPIVYCELCDSGVHQKCYGIDDLDEPFYCDLCQLRRKRQEVDTPLKNGVQIGVSCFICNRSGGMLRFDPNYSKS
jgi:hypothetical protein